MYYRSEAVNVKASPILLLSPASRTTLKPRVLEPRTSILDPRSSIPAWDVAVVSASPCKPKETQKNGNKLGRRHCPADRPSQSIGYLKLTIRVRWYLWQWCISCKAVRLLLDVDIFLSHSTHKQTHTHTRTHPLKPYLQQKDSAGLGTRPVNCETPRLAPYRVEGMRKDSLAPLPTSPEKSCPRSPTISRLPPPVLLSPLTP